MAATMTATMRATKTARKHLFDKSSRSIDARSHASSQDSAMALSIEWAPVLSGVGAQSPLLLSKPSNIVDEGGVKFLKVKKSDRRLQTALLWNIDSQRTPRLSTQSRPLACTDVIERLIELRNAKYAELLAQEQGSAQRKTGLNDDAPEASRDRSRRVKNQANIAKAATIEAPRVGEINGIRISVLLSATPSSPLYIEIKAANIEYLRQVVAYQISAGSVLRAPHQSASPLGGGLTALRRGKYSFRCKKRRADGSVANFYIKNAPADIAKTMASDFDPDTRKRRRGWRHAEPKDDDHDDEEEDDDDDDDAEEEEDTLDGAPAATPFLVKQEPSVATIVKKEVEDLRQKFANASPTGTIVIESSESESGID